MAADHQHAEFGPCVARDSAGNLRDRCGTGMIVARPMNTSVHVADWLRELVDGEARELYGAALRVLRAEEDTAMKARRSGSPDPLYRLRLVRDQVSSPELRRELDGIIRDLKD